MSSSPGAGDARSAGRHAVTSARRRLAQRALEVLVERDPDLLANLTEIGVVGRDWVERGGTGPLDRATPIEMVERLLQRSVERRPSMLAALGLNAIQLMSSGTDDDGTGVMQHLTVVFTDLEDFTAFTERAGDAAATELLGRHHRVAGPVIRSRGGKIVKRLGDGLLLTFPSAEAAVLAGIELVRAEPESLRVRAGMHTGDVIVTVDDVIGTTVNVAARVADLAAGGEVLVTSALIDAAGPGFGDVTFSEPRLVGLKGLEELVAVARATAADAAGTS